MKKVSLILSCILVLFFSTPVVSAQSSKLIHYWHFNSTLPADGSGGISFGPHRILADYSTLENAALVYEPIPAATTDTGYIDNLSGDTINQRIGFGGCCGSINNAVRTRNPSYQMQFLWYLPTSKYKNIVVTYETELSSFKSGQHEQVISYSLDSASSFITNGLLVTSVFADTVWTKEVIDFQGIDGANNNSKFVLKITFSGTNTGTKGNNRFDNITVEGDSIDGTAVINKGSWDAYTLFPNPAQEWIKLTTNRGDSKTITVFNASGALIATYNMPGDELVIKTSELGKGLYILKISEPHSQKVLKFIKN